MTANIINLRKARKAKARSDKESQAEVNRAKFGRTKAERQKSEADAALKGRRLEQHKRETGDGEPDQ